MWGAKNRCRQSTPGVADISGGGGQRVLPLSIQTVAKCLELRSRLEV